MNARDQIRADPDDPFDLISYTSVQYTLYDTQLVYRISTALAANLPYLPWHIHHPGKVLFGLHSLAHLWCYPPTAKPRLDPAYGYWIGESINVICECAMRASDG